MQKEMLVPILIVVTLMFGTTFVLKQRYAVTQLPPKSSPTTSEEREEVSMVVSDFGKQLANVPLASTKDAAAIAIETTYRPYASANLLATWKNDPLKAPGRNASSPWPDRIEIHSIQKSQDNSYTVQGRVIEVTSRDVTRGKIAASYPVEITLAKEKENWMITAFSKGAYATSTERE